MIVFYPYLNQASKWQELKFSLRSLEENFLEDFSLVVIGDRLPQWLNEKSVTFHPHYRTSEGGACQDANFKMDVLIKAYPREDILCMYDDIYLLKPIGKDFLHRMFAMKDCTNTTAYIGEMASSSSVWNKTFIRTMWTLKQKGYPAIDFETHLPRLINTAIMQKCFTTFAMPAQRLQRFSLYYNFFIKQKPQLHAHVELLHKEDDIKAGFYGLQSAQSFLSDKLEHICEITERKHILNHDDAGLTPALRAYIEQQFPNKSRFEL